MTLEPLLAAPLAIQFHVATVVPAAFLGAFLLARPKGTRWHRRLGRIWICLMVVSALSTFFIHTIDVFLGFSPIHILSVFVLWSSVEAVRMARAGRMAAHRRNVLGMYIGGIVVAGGLTFVPGRLMHSVVFSDWAAGSLLTSLLLLIVLVILVGPPIMTLRGPIGKMDGR